MPSRRVWPKPNASTSTVRCANRSKYIRHFQQGSRRFLIEKWSKPVRNEGSVDSTRRPEGLLRTCHTVFCCIAFSLTVCTSFIFQVQLMSMRQSPPWWRLYEWTNPTKMHGTSQRSTELSCLPTSQLRSFSMSEGITEDQKISNLWRA